MSEKTISNVRVINKHDIEENWLKATGFTPKQGELIIYDIDDNYDYERVKIGDGEHNVNDLPFVNDELKEYVDESIASIPTPDVSGQIATHNTSDTAHSDIRNAISDISALVGDTSVADQIAAANTIYIGPDMPTDSNIKVWINTSEEGTGVVPILPRITNITLKADNWTGSSNPWSQAVDITADANIGISSKLDPQPTAQQIVSMQNEETSIMLSNEGGSVVAYAIGNKPTVDYTMQVLITEVAFV